MASFVLVSYPDYFSHAEEKNIVRSTDCPIFVPCGLKMGDATSSKMYYVTSHKAWKYVRKSSKETAYCRDHPSRSFQTPRNEDSQNMMPLSTSNSPETILLTFESLRNFTQPVFKLRNTHHLFKVLAFLRQSFSGSTRLSLLHSASTAI